MFASHKRTVIGLSAIGLTVLIAGAAQAAVLPVTNLQFVGNAMTQSKELFSTVAPTGWSTSSSSSDPLIYVGQQGSEGTSFGPTPNIYGVYSSSPGFSDTVPAGTNFYQADGNPSFEDTIFETISGLTAGTTYTLQFQQAAGQQTGFTGDTTEQWKVFLGVGGIGVDCTTNPCTVTGTTNNQEQDSTLMSNSTPSNTDWESVTLSFTPTAAELSSGSAILTFLAWGDSGSTTNLPPTLFLEGVNTPPVSTPEPMTMSLFGAGIAGAVALRRRRKAKQKA